MQKDAPFVGECNIQFEGRDLNTDPVIQEKPVHGLSRISNYIDNL